MGKNLGTKLAIIVVVMLFFIYGIIGIPKHGFKQALQHNIKLGLDLQGGTHLVLAVHVNEAVASATDRDVQRLQTALATAGATASKADPVNKPTVITVSGVPAAQSSTVSDLIRANDYSGYDVTKNSDGTFTMTMKPSAIAETESRTVDQTIETIYERINSLGVSEPTVQKYGLGENQILVEMPGLSNLDEIKNAIQSTAKLAVHAVVSGPYADDAAAMAALNNTVPPEDMLVHGTAIPNSPDQVFLLQRASEVEGTDFRDARGSTDPNGRPNIAFTLTTEAGQRFYKYTSAHSSSSATPGSMAIVYGGRVKEVASIQSAISDSGEITGSFTKSEVDNLSLMLRTGALPASLDYIETRTVGPSLGAASIRQGVVAALAGMAAVMLFMLVYYRGSGINADLALILNLIILLGFMGYSGAVLTLPGIAGVILTIGMGVDSNVLIFERIREELRSGKTAAAAVKEGFAHAWITIVDTHVTTIVSAVILLMFGTGPVKGFAVTLMVGLFANLVTAVFVSRLIFDWHLQGRERTAALSI